MAVTTTGFSTTGYIPGGSSPGPSASLNDQDQVDGFWDLAKCRRAYNTYLDSKQMEIQEQQNARRYRHGVQWTAEQIKVLNDRKQPVVTFNRIGRKIDGIVGLVEKLKQDPKAYPRTPSHQQGADLATAVLRYLTEANRWDEKSPKASEAAAIDGLAGIELDLKTVPPPSHMQGMQQQAQPDYDVIFRNVDNDGFFYDPRSFQHDFSDARFIGMGKFVDEEMLLELMPDYADLIRDGGADQTDLTSSSDRDDRWFQNNGDFKQVRLVDIWYKSGRGWRWALFTGGTILKQGQSPFTDEYGAEFAKYIMFSAAVDQDGDRYGFPRNLMSAQDEINQRRSKALHNANSRRIRAVKAAVADTNVEALRREGARPDGVVLSNTSIDDIQFDDTANNSALMAQFQFLNEAKAEIENFGPNPALVGQGAGGVGGSSGRAISLLQQAGIAELGPYMLNLRGWKLRVYRALFNTAKKYWTNQRWIRVTDQQGQPQFVEINGIGQDQTGMPSVINPIGELDVDIILDEGPDTITIMQDTYDAISQALPAVAKMLSPGQAAAAMEVLIESSQLPAEVKKKFRDAGQKDQEQPQVSPEQQKMQMEMQAQQQKDQATLQLEQQKAALNSQTKTADAQNDMQIAREKAQNDMAIAQFKATQEAAIKREQAAAEMRARQTEMIGGIAAGVIQAQHGPASPFTPAE
jgi:hypothetical protein